MGNKVTCGIAALLTAFSAGSLCGQAAPAEPDPLNAAVQLGNGFLQRQLSIATSSMSEEDYAFRPTPDVRTFGQIIAHIAENNYFFCAVANGDSVPPVRDIEKTTAAKAEIERALTESDAYCAGVFASMTADKARGMVQFGRSRHPAMAVLMFKSFHNSLHYGNVITYMRLRGKVPPPSAL